MEDEGAEKKDAYFAFYITTQIKCISAKVQNLVAMSNIQD